MIKKIFFRLVFFVFFSLLLFFIFVSQVSALECTPPKQYCSENYTVPCDNGGVKQCFKEGCNETGGGGPTCPWQGKSNCGECSNPGAPVPTAPVESCNIRSGGEVGSCVRISGNRSCQPSCSNDWSASPSEPDVECKALVCEPCGNNTTCCRKKSQPPQNPPRCDSSCGTCGWRDSNNQCQNGQPMPNGTWCCHRICNNNNVCQTVSGVGDNDSRCPSGSDGQSCAGNPPSRPTNTPIPTKTPTPTNTPIPGAPTNTPVPGAPTNTPIPGAPTNTPVPGAPTNTPIPGQPTDTPVPGTPTPTYIPVALPTYRPGQTNPLNQSRPAQTWRCLKSDYYVGPIRPNGMSDHRLKLTGEKFPTKTDIYIVGCVASAGGTKCTSGDDDLDKTLQLGKDQEHIFYVDSPNPMVTTDYNGKVEKVVYSHSQTSTVHAFYAILLNEPVVDERSGGTIQYKSFKFKEDLTKCTAVRWDPYGRVFDSQSLEPIPNLKVTILDLNKKPVNLPGLINPDTTKASGVFNFLVEPGSYYLEVEPDKNHRFLKNPNLDPGYIKAYSNIYRPDDLIVEEKGQPEHRDIPLDPGENEPYRSSPSSVNFAVLPIAGANQTKIVGQVSHPLTIVSLRQNNKEIAKTWADKMGFYEVLIDNEKIVQGVKIVPVFTKVNLAENQPVSKQKQIVFVKIFDYLLSLFKKKTTASTTAFGVPINPIPRYLEGYLEPLALVNVRLTMSDKIYWQTKTDEKGFLVVLPQNLPPLDYYLEIIPQNASPFTLTTSEFIEKNKYYLQTNEINLLTATKKGQEIK